MPESQPSPLGKLLCFRVHDWLIVFVLLLAAVQVTRSDFLVNESFIDWSRYAAGTGFKPYQGRVGMMPLLQWAEKSSEMQHLARRYDGMTSIAVRCHEPVTVEKFASLAAALVSMLFLLSNAIRQGLRSGRPPWWLSSALLLVILAATLDVRAEHAIWYPYDLPHAALFGVAVLSAINAEWLFMLTLFAADVPMRETSIFLVLVAPVLFYHSCKGSKRVRRLQTLLLSAAMLLYWGIVRWSIHVRFLHNGDDTGPRFAINLHELLWPHHWSQTLSAGGYLLIFLWLERRRLPPRELLVLYCCIPCALVDIYFGVWTETRIWLEWSLPWAVLCATAAVQYLRSSDFQRDSPTTIPACR